MNKKQLKFFTSTGLVGINGIFSWIVFNYPPSETTPQILISGLIRASFVCGAILLTYLYLGYYEKQNEEMKELTPQWIFKAYLTTK